MPPPRRPVDELLDVLGGDAVEVAPRLLGATLEVGPCVGRIVEVEAYRGADDAASHARMGPTPRNTPMFGPPGVLYVYFTYGMHWCANVVTGPAGDGQAVLLRAVEPISGLDQMRTRRPKARRDVDLTNGPAKLCAAFGIDGTHNATSLVSGPVHLHLAPPATADEVRSGPRIGISAAVDLPWRFWLRSSRYVSR